MGSIKLWEAFKSKDTLDLWLKLGELKEKTEKHLNKEIWAFEVWKNKQANEIYYSMTRTPEIKEQSIKFIDELIKNALKNSKNSEAINILEKLA